MGIQNESQATERAIREMLRLFQIKKQTSILLRVRR